MLTCYCKYINNLIIEYIYKSIGGGNIVSGEFIRGKDPWSKWRFHWGGGGMMD